MLRLRKPRTAMTVDINLGNVALAVFTTNGKLLRLRRFKTPLGKILTQRIWIERAQRRYARSWRLIKCPRLLSVSRSL